jgi:hypothetical protein
MFCALIIIEDKERNKHHEILFIWDFDETDSY